MSLLPTQLPLFDGAVDTSGLRSYLNILVRAINAVIEYIGTSISPVTTLRTVTGDFAVDLNDDVILIDAPNVDVTGTFDATLATPGQAKRVQIMRIDGTDAVTSINDGNGVLRDTFSAPGVAGVAPGRWVVSDATNIWSQNG
jgi:hypothetical protein